MIRNAIIVGGGIAGLSTAWALRRRGISVKLFEQGALPNARSSSVDEHRVTRHAYGRLAGYSRLMPRAFDLWDMLWKALGRSHYDPCGTVVFLRHDDGWYDAVAQSLDEVGVGHREIPLRDVEARFPMIRPDGLVRVVETDGAGILFAQAIMTDFVGLLAELGVDFHPYSHVEQVDAERGSVIVDGQTYHADAVVVAGGAWNDRLVPDLRKDVVPSRQGVLFLAPPPELVSAWRNAPVMIDAAMGGGLYALPPRGGMRLKIGDHSFSRIGDPDGDRIATDVDLERLWGPARVALRDFDAYRVIERRACFYTVNDKEEFQVRPIGPMGWVVSACSGHGFKLAPYVGDLVAAALTGELDGAHVPDIAAGRAEDIRPRQPRELVP